jgi:hypothetical protein
MELYKPTNTVIRFFVQQHLVTQLKALYYLIFQLIVNSLLIQVNSFVVMPNFTKCIMLEHKYNFVIVYYVMCQLMD